MKNKKNIEPVLNVVIPMAGLGTRFAENDSFTPKSFIEVNGKPMFVRVIENFKHPEARFILIARKEHIQSEIKLVREAKKKYNAKFIPIEKLTEGSLSTVLFARKKINNDVPLLIVMADQVVDFDMNDFLNDCTNKKLDGNIICFPANEPNLSLSYAKVSDSGDVSLVKEKEVISNLATAGIYYFKKGKYFVNGAIDMIINNDRVNNEFYVAPVYNYLISEKKKIGTYNIKKEQIHDLGTKAQLEVYLQKLLCEIFYKKQTNYEL